MSEGVFISRTDFNRLVKKIDFLEEFVKAQLKTNQFTRWVPASVAMEMLGVKERKLRELRAAGVVQWKTSGKGRNIMILRESIEKFNKMNSTVI